MFPIIKLNHVINNQISKIYVFIGNESSEGNFATINQRLNLFTEDEFRHIQENDISVEYVKKFIHPDDTIIRIKEKIFNEIDELNISINEIYLFSLITKKINIDDIIFDYQNNSLQDQVTINKLKLFLMNFVKSSMDLTILDETLSNFNPSEENIYETLQKLNIDWNNTLLLTKSLGNYVNTKNNYPYVSNPFLVKNDDYLIRESNNIISTQNNNCLFKFFPLKNNNLYLTTAENVLEFNVSRGIKEDYILKLYFPILFKKDNIHSLEELLSQKGNLKDKDETKIKKYYKSYNKRINLLYNIYKNTKGLLNNKKYGIEFIHFTIKPIYAIKMPLELLFKSINSSETIPLIKYNPGKAYENIFRLYTNGHISTTGSKIPDLYVKDGLKKKKLFEISKQLAKVKALGFYIYSIFEETHYEIYCNILENGNIEIKCALENLLLVENLENLMLSTVNDNILSNISVFLKQKGYKYSLFESFSQENVTINNIHYKFSVPTTKKINISKISGCITPLFNINSSTKSKTDGLVKLTYKRVSSFHLMNSILSFITIQKQHAESYQNIIKLLMHNFEQEIDTEMKARTYLQQWSEEIKIKTETYGNKNRIVDSNPGFDTIIFNEVFPETTFLSIIMQNINNIHYIPILNIYLHSISILLQRIELNEELNEKVNSMCKKVSKKLKNIEEVDIDIREEPSKTDPIMFDNDSQEELSELSDFDEDEDDDEIDFGELMEKEKTQNMEKEVSVDSVSTSLKISDSL